LIEEEDIGNAMH
jgi:hypothetical protein